METKVKKPPLQVQVVEKRRMTPEQIEARKRTRIANVADKVFNQRSAK